MQGLDLIKRFCLAAALFAFATPQAEAIGALSPAAAHVKDGAVLTAALHRSGGGHHGGARRPPGHPGHRPVAPARRPGRGPGHPHYSRPAYHPAYYPWARPDWYRWAPGGAVAAGAAMGFVTAETASAWAGAPQAGLCWYYTDPTRRQGFWDQCP